MDESFYLGHRSEDGTRVQPLLEHLQNVADLTKEFASVFGAGELGYCIGLTHDLGKYSQVFQERIRGANVHVDHSTAGGQYFDSLKESNLLHRLAAYCILGHHGGLPNGGTGSDTASDSTLVGRLKRQLEDYGAYETEVDIPSLVPPTFSPSNGFSMAFFTRMLFSALVDADWLDTEAFVSEGKKIRGGFETLDSLRMMLDRHLEQFKFPTNELNVKRTELLENCRTVAHQTTGLFTLTAPTGSGKTLSSIAFSLTHAIENNQRRIIYVIPYNTIIEQNAEVFERIFGAENVIQHHSGIDYSSDENSQDYRKRLATENWDAPIIVTSSVRFFESLFSNKPSACRKLHNIANSVIVFDEAQMIPLPHLLPCIEAMKELAAGSDCSIVLATATQSSLDAYFKPLSLTEITEDPQGLYEFFRRVTFKVMIEPIAEDRLASELKAQNQVLCVVNKRKRAQSLAEKLGDDVFHLSTTMYPVHRSRVLSEIRRRLKEGEPCRVISTSMIEAGVDVDFPVLYREKAGLDSVIQAAGRCNREGKHQTEESIVHVFVTEDDAPTFITQNVAAYEHVIRSHKDIGSLEAIQTYFEQLRYLVGQEELDKESVLERLNNGARSALFSFKCVAKDFKLIDEDTCTVIIPIEGDAKLLVDRLRFGERSRDLLRSVQRYSVSLYRSDIRRLLELGGVDYIDEELLVLAEHYYDKRYGVTLSPGGGMGIFA